MSQPSVPSTGYGTTAMALHWITAVLVLAAFIMGPGGSELKVYSAARDFDREVHEVLGLAVFTLTLLRLGWRAFIPAPPALPMAAWMERTSRVVQVLLYILLLAIPVSAIIGAWLEGHPLTLGILGSIPPMIPESRAVGEKVSELHTILGDAVVWVAGLHAAAALFHHFILRDVVLTSMLPRRMRRPR